ncbi:hypothetical protein D3C71_1628680 [compost metagenome]
MTLRAPSGLQGGACRHSLQAVTVIRANTVKIVIRMASDQGMPAFRMHQAMNCPAFRIHADADSGTDGIIQAAGQTLCGAPFGFAQSSGVHIGIPAEWHRELPPQDAEQIVLRPAWLGRRRHEPVGWALRRNINRAE